jgi:hypothetical protein
MRVRMMLSPTPSPPDPVTVVVAVPGAELARVGESLPLSAVRATAPRSINGKASAARSRSVAATEDPVAGVAGGGLTGDGPDEAIAPRDGSALALSAATPSESIRLLR